MLVQRAFLTNSIPMCKYFIEWFSLRRPCRSARRHEPLNVGQHLPSVRKRTNWSAAVTE